MGVDELTTLISAMGFPIVACIGLFYFIKYQYDTSNKVIVETLTELKNGIDVLITTINNKLN